MLYQKLFVSALHLLVRLDVIRQRNALKLFKLITFNYTQRHLYCHSIPTHVSNVPTKRKYQYKNLRILELVVITRFN